MKKNNLSVNKIINFIGYFFLILGFFALVKISFNFIYYKEYPLTPVLPFNPFTYYQTEEDCKNQFNYPYYNEKGEIRPPSNDEKKIQEKNLESCLKKVKQDRENNKINDIWTAILFLILGGGINLTKKWYLEEKG
jgi:hypothetical protein